ncbi:MAG: pyridoxal phosphate-dependent aminotransferase [Synergistaceae bacterium]|nr:pyridoxal phosphate-dependent aminotransferase [Synergistaceae bacterium]
MKLSERALSITPSATLSISDKAKELKAQGKPILSFSAGEPDFISPPSACRAAIEAIERGETHYTPNSGIGELKKAVAGYYKNHFGLEYALGEILITSGVKTMLYETIQALVDPGDEVLLFAPAWVSYLEQIRLAGGKPVSVDTSESGFSPTLREINESVTSRTRGMIINTPNNPTGAVYSEKTLRMLADAAVEHDLWIIFDEVYERLVYGSAKHVNILQTAPEIRDRVIIANGVSKAYCMTGWRIGYALGPGGVIKKIDGIQSHLTSNASSIAQWAAAAAINEAEGDVEVCRAEFEKRRDIICGLLSGIKPLKFASPDGAFYIFIDVRDTRLPDDIEFCQKLLEEKYVALVPGAAFSAPGYVRLSYSCSESDLRSGAERIREFIEARS